MGKLIDLTGMEFGRLTVLERAENQVTPNGTVRTMWKCQCECGNIIVVGTQHLRNGDSQSCGCLKRELTSKRRLDDFTGKRFGRLTVIERAETVHVSTRWKCVCDCGNETIVLAENLKTGHTTSCGCFREENRPNLRMTHGYKSKYKRAYAVWEKIKSRTCNPKNPCFYRYGAIGIDICEEWKNDPVAFIDWLYSAGYDENAEYGECTVERIDNTKGYSPENCRVTSNLEQQNNKRTNVRLTHNGETHTMSEWSRILGIPYSFLSYHCRGRDRSIGEAIRRYGERK